MLLATVATGAFLAAFGGSWSCALQTPGALSHATAGWTIAAVPRSRWTRLTFASAHDGGVAYVGYLPLEERWVEHVFHDDGTYAERTSPGPVNGAWTWTGAITGAGRVTPDAVQWRREGETIRRAYGRTIGSSFRASAGDVCRPAR